jgi:DNA-binding MarR family transcriptional regulator
MTTYSVLSTSSSERAERFIDNIRKLLFLISADSYADSAEAERRLGEIPKGAGRIAGPIAFSTLGNILRRREAVTMGAITRGLLVPPSTANRLVSWWVDNGLAERLSDPNDKRVIRVRITEEGIRFQEVTQDIAITRINSFFSKLTPEEATIFSLLFDKLTSKFEDLPTD